jgi:hypothetical protein
VILVAKEKKAERYFHLFLNINNNIMMYYEP